MVISTPQAKHSAEDLKENEKKSYLNVVFFCAFLLGVGMMLGYSVFYFIFQEKCAGMLLDQDRKRNSSFVELETKYKRAITDVQQCQEDSEARERTKVLEGRLAAQAALSDKHQELLARHERTLEKISELQSTSEGSQAQIQSLKEEIKNIQVSLDESSQKLRAANFERDDIQQQLQRHMAETSKTLKEREQENMELREVLDSCDDKIKNTEGKFNELRNLVQQNQYAQIIAM
jgi:chromosome segregation ATPase